MYHVLWRIRHIWAIVELKKLINLRSKLQHFFLNLETIPWTKAVNFGRWHDLVTVIHCVKSGFDQSRVLLGRRLTRWVLPTKVYVSCVILQSADALQCDTLVITLRQWSSQIWAEAFSGPKQRQVIAIRKCLLSVYSTCTSVAVMMLRVFLRRQCVRLK